VALARHVRAQTGRPLDGRPFPMLLPPPAAAALRAGASRVASVRLRPRAPVATWIRPGDPPPSAPPAETPFTPVPELYPPLRETPEIPSRSPQEMPPRREAPEVPPPEQAPPYTTPEVPQQPPPERTRRPDFPPELVPSPERPPPPDVQPGVVPMPPQKPPLVPPAPMPNPLPETRVPPAPMPNVMPEAMRAAAAASATPGLLGQPRQQHAAEETTMEA